MIMEEARPAELEALDKRMFYQLYVRPNLYKHLKPFTNSAINQSPSMKSESTTRRDSPRMEDRHKRERKKSRTDMINKFEYREAFDSSGKSTRHIQQQQQSDLPHAESSKSASLVRSTSRTNDATDFLEGDIKTVFNDEVSDQEEDGDGEMRRRTILVNDSSDPNLLETKFSDETFQRTIQAVWQMQVAPSRWLSLISWFVTTFALLVFCLLNYRTSYFLTTLEGSFIAGLNDAFVDENEFSGQPGFREIGDDSGWFEWFEGAFVSNLYADEVPQVSNLPSDVMRYSRLVGVPRVVNIKVPNQTCAGSISDVVSDEGCYAPVLETLLLSLEQEKTQISYDNLSILGSEADAKLLEKSWQTDMTAKHIFTIPLPYNNRTHALEVSARMKKDPNF